MLDDMRPCLSMSYEKQGFQNPEQMAEGNIHTCKGLLR